MEKHDLRIKKQNEKLTRQCSEWKVRYEAVKSENERVDKQMIEVEKRLDATQEALKIQTEKILRTPPEKTPAEKEEEENFELLNRRAIMACDSNFPHPILQM